MLLSYGRQSSGARRCAVTLTQKQVITSDTIGSEGAHSARTCQLRYTSASLGMSDTRMPELPSSRVGMSTRNRVGAETSSNYCRSREEYRRRNREE